MQISSLKLTHLKTFSNIGLSCIILRIGFGVSVVVLVVLSEVAGDEDDDDGWICDEDVCCCCCWEVVGLVANVVLNVVEEELSVLRVVFDC